MMNLIEYILIQYIQFCNSWFHRLFDYLIGNQYVKFLADKIILGIRLILSTVPPGLLASTIVQPDRNCRNLVMKFIISMIPKYVSRDIA